MPLRNKFASPPVSLESQLFVAILKTADVLAQQAEQLVKSAGLTRAQYNVLRILRGVESGGLLCREVGERMISHDPDITRLLDRMEKRGLVRRHREKEDRRVVKACITDEGLKLLKKLDQPVRDLHQRQFQRLGTARLNTLAQLLQDLRKAESP